jgi:transposase
MTGAPDGVVGHEPGRCAGCGKDLAGAPLAGAGRRQVTDLPPDIWALVTEHRLICRRCGCGMVTAAAAPAGATAPVQYGPRLPAIGAYLWHGQFLSRNRTCQAMAELSASRSPRGR